MVLKEITIQSREGIAGGLIIQSNLPAQETLRMLLGAAQLIRYSMGEQLYDATDNKDGKLN